MTRPSLAHLAVPTDQDVILDERRAQDRYACNLRSFCRPIEHPRSGSPWPARLLDVSATGLRMLMARRFEPGALLSIEVRTSEGDSLTILAHVVRVHASGRTRTLWSLGCTLASVLSDDDLEQLVETPHSAWLKSKRLLLAEVEQVAARELEEMPTLELVVPEELTDTVDVLVLDGAEEITLEAVLTEPLLAIGLAGFVEAEVEPSRQPHDLACQECEDETGYRDLPGALAESVPLIGEVGNLSLGASSLMDACWEDVSAAYERKCA